MGSLTALALSFLAKTVDFADGTSYELLSALTDFRKCHDGTPLESRIVFSCRQAQGSEASKEDLIMKIKVQAPEDNSTPPHKGPSTTTAAELDALERFRNADNSAAPHLVAFHRALQGSDGPLPGGFITYTVMTKMPGQSLLDLNYWQMSERERDDIRTKFLQALRSIYALGIEPQDRALRNILWERDTRICTVIDFELWKETTENVADHMKEFQRWGVARRPPPRDWWAEWNMQGR